MATIGKLTVDLQANTAAFQRDMTRAVSSVRSSSAQINRQLATINNGFSSIKRAAAGLSIGFFAVQSIKRAADYGETIYKLSNRLNSTTEAVSRLAFAAKQTDIDFTAFTGGLENMVIRASQAAQGTGKAAGAIRELGINAAELNKLQPDKQIGMLADALLRIPNQNDRLRIAKMLFGENAGEFMDLLSLGAEGIRQLGEAADKSGNTLDSKTAAGANKLNDSLKMLDSTYQGLLMSVASTGVFDELSNAMTKLSEATNIAREGWRNYIDALRQNHGKAPKEVIEKLSPDKAKTLNNAYSVMASAQKERDRLIEEQNNPYRKLMEKPDNTAAIEAAHKKVDEARKKARTLQELFSSDQATKDNWKSTSSQWQSAIKPTVPTIDSTSIERASKSTKALNKTLNEHREVLQLIKTDEDYRLEQMDKLNAALREGVITNEQFETGVGKINDKYSELEPVLSDLSNKIQGMFEGSIRPAQALRSVLGDIAAQILKTQLGKIGTPSISGGDGGGIFGNILGSISGNIGSIFKSFPSFDAGGYTGSQSGMGVDGKGGFPALLHPNETVIPAGGAVANSGGANVTQIINFQSTTDDTVRKQIMAFMPTFRNIAKQAVNEELARGGRAAKLVGNRF